MQRFDVAIVGMGIAGASLANALGMNSIYLMRAIQMPSLKICLLDTANVLQLTTLKFSSDSYSNRFSSVFL